MAHGSLGPALEIRRLLQESRQLGADQSMLRLAEVEYPKQERTRLDLEQKLSASIRKQQNPKQQDIPRP